jgi:hypothetical protein
MCTTILTNINNVFDIDTLKNISYKYDLHLNFTDIKPHFTYLKKRLNTSIIGNTSFTIFQKNEECSCSIIEEIQEAVSNEIDFSKLALFKFIDDILNFDVDFMYLLISEEELIYNNLKFFKVSTNEFINFLYRHYSWLTEDEIKDWVYDVNAIFKISKKKVE